MSDEPLIDYAKQRAAWMRRLESLDKIGASIAEKLLSEDCRVYPVHDEQSCSVSFTDLPLTLDLADDSWDGEDATFPGFSLKHWESVKGHPDEPEDIDYAELIVSDCDWDVAVKFIDKVWELNRERVLESMRPDMGDAVVIEIIFSRTPAGSLRGEFEDDAGSLCAIQESRYPGCLLLGREQTRMRLTREMVRALLPHLAHFADTGRLPEHLKD